MKNLKNNFILKPGMGVLLNYFSLYMNDMGTMLPLSREIKKFDKTKFSSAAFYLFGYCDVLQIGVSNSYKMLDKMQQMDSYQKINGVKDFFIHYGTILSIYPNSRNFSLDHALKDNNFVGVVAVKIKSESWKQVLKKVDIFNEFSLKFNFLFKQAITKTNQDCNLLNSENYKAILLVSYGSEDGIVILFTNSLQYIKTLSTNIRTFDTSDINSSNPKIKHIVGSTTTVLGFKMDLENFQIRIPKIQNEYDKINWWTFYEARPGHLQHSIDELKKNKSLEVQPIAGRNDLMVFPKKAAACNVSDFLKTHFNLFKQTSKVLSLFSSETYISFPSLNNVETKRAPKHDHYTNNVEVGKSVNKLIERIKKSRKLSLMEKESFIQILRKLLYLINDRHAEDSFYTLLPVIIQGIREFLLLNPKYRSPNSDLWTGFIESCFANRYHGSPPIAETAVISTLGHYSSGQKVLALLDLMANRIIKNIIKKSKRLKSVPIYVVTNNTNCQTAAQIPILPIPISFILLPPNPLFNPKILLFTFFHELGHIIFDCFFFKSQFNKDIYKEELREEVSLLEESMAEFFSIKILSNLNFSKHKSQLINIIKLFGYEDKDTKEAFYGTKKTHTTIAELFYINKNQAISNKLEGYFPNLTALDSFKFVADYVNLISKWDDEMIVRIRKLFDASSNSNNFQSEFWNLWIYFWSRREDCYAEMRNG